MTKKIIKKSKILLRPITSLLLITILLVSLTACASKGDGTTIRYIVNNVNDVTVLDIALAKDFFKDEGVKVEEVGTAGGGAAAIQAVAGDDADIANAAIPAYINAVSADTPIKVVYGGTASGHEGYHGHLLLVRAGSGIKTAQDLKGKTVAVAARGAMFEFMVRIYLANNGLTVDDINLIVVPATQHEQVLESGQADACVDGPPIGDKIVEDGAGEVLSDLYTIQGPELSEMGWGYFVNTDLLEKDPETVKSLVSALIKTDEWTEANPDEARKVVEGILEKRGLDADLAKYWKPVKLFDHGLWNDKNVQFWIDFMEDNTELEKDSVTPADIYTNEFNPYYDK